jgi:hypothetical protein
MTLGRTGRGWEGNIKTDIQDVGGEEWTGLYSLSVGIGDGRL